jgi:hypothetical protein
MFTKIRRAPVNQICCVSVVERRALSKVKIRHVFSEAGSGRQKSGNSVIMETGLSGSKANLMRAIYLTAILASTLGWIWLIAWIARQLL